MNRRRRITNAAAAQNLFANLPWFRINVNIVQHIPHAAHPCACPASVVFSLDLKLAFKLSQVLDNELHTLHTHDVPRI